MLLISKVASGVAVDGTAEYSMFVVDDKENVYEVHTDGDVYAQLLEVIGASILGSSTEQPQENTEGKWGDGTRSRLADLIAPPQHSVDGVDRRGGESPQPDGPSGENGASMASVGFDVDYSAEFEDAEEEDPGEEGMTEEDQFVEPL